MALIKNARTSTGEESIVESLGKSGETHCLAPCRWEQLVHRAVTSPKRGSSLSHRRPPGQ